MTKPNALVAALTTRLAPRPLALAIDFAEAFASQPNLPAWLLSLDALTDDARREMLRQAAHVLRTELPDRASAALLAQLAADSEIFRGIVSALRSIGVEAPAEQGNKPIAGRNAVQLYAASAEGRIVVAP